MCSDRLSAAATTCSATAARTGCTARAATTRSRATANDDLIEGNQGNDWLEGNDGEDDIVGGSSALGLRGRTSPVVTGADLGDPDGTDAVFGGGGADVLAGDNAVVIRKTAGNTTVYNAALPTAYFTSDHEDAVPGWWLGVTTNRLVRAARPDDVDFGPLRLATSSRPVRRTDVVFGQDGNDWVAGGANDDAIEGNGGADILYGDQRPGVERHRTVSRWSRLPSSPGSASSTATDRRQPDGEDDIVGGSNVSHRDGNDTVNGDGEDDFVLGDNGPLQRNIAGGAYVRYLGDGTHDRFVRRATRLDVGASAASGVWGGDTLRGNPATMPSGARTATMASTAKPATTTCSVSSVTTPCTAAPARMP